MSCGLSLKQITPTVFLKGKEQALQQLVEITVENIGTGCKAVVQTRMMNAVREHPLGTVPAGESVHDIFIDEPQTAIDVDYVLKSGETVEDRRSLPLAPPKHWRIHVVHLSHHDVGYTDLASNVLKMHDGYLHDAVDMAESTNSFPRDAQFRIVIEQVWSVSHFLENSSSLQIEKLIELVRAGRFEITALFGNMITEICGHEELIRSLYHAFGLKRKYGFPIVSAQHNDITGISWGLSHVLTEAGIKIFCPGLPLYYNWNKELDLQSFWDEKKLFPHGGPGAFWWEAPSGKRILFWSNNSGCNGDMRTDMPDLPAKLQELTDRQFPYSVIRWPVNGGARDNSPYTDGYAKTIKKWNEQWRFPHLISSTNARFYDEFKDQIREDLPVFRGELPGQDYPTGSTSTAYSTAVNRNTHAALLTAEKLAAAAFTMTDYSYQQKRLFQCYDEILWHDEHTWGHVMPCGPSSKASEYEKAVHAHRGAALVHDVSSKALARIADSVKLEDEGFHLVVFNSTSREKTGVVRTPLREIDNCGSTMTWISPEEDPKGSGYLKGVLLHDRWHANPPAEIIEGKFTLVDLAAGEEEEYQIAGIESPDETVPHAAERLGVGTGTKRLGLFKDPVGLKRDLVFVARNVPPLGYKTYRLKPAVQPPQYTTTLKRGGAVLENEYYKIKIEEQSGSVTGIFDKEAEVELIDPECPFSLAEFVVRNPVDGAKYTRENKKAVQRSAGPLSASVEITSSSFGHPGIRQSISLYKGIKQIYIDTRILKDSTPLLDAHIAFPFLTSKPKFRYEGVLSAMHPVEDYLPGAYSDTLAIGNWVKISDNGFNILWASLDAPVAGFSDLWRGYVSPAHRCLVTDDIMHSPLTGKNLVHGWIFSNVFYNNFGTNFSITQPGDTLFRYVITTRKGAVSDGEAARFGWQAATPFEHIFTKNPRRGSLEVSESFLSIDSADIILITAKLAEDGNGYILRLWNTASEPVESGIVLNTVRVSEVRLTNLVEEDTGESLPFTGNSFSLAIDRRTVSTVRVIPAR